MKRIQIKRDEAESSCWVIDLPLEAFVEVFGIFLFQVDYLGSKGKIECGFRLANAGDVRSAGALRDELIFRGDGCSDLPSGACQIDRFDVHEVEIAALSFLCQYDGIVRFQFNFASVEQKRGEMGEFLSLLRHELRLL